MLDRACHKFVDWMKQDALPFWAKAAIDPDGGVFEFLNMDGTPINDIKRRVRVQARYTYTFAHASHLGWYDGRAESDHAWKYLLGPGSAGSENFSGAGYKGCAHLLNPDGSLHDNLRDTYAQAFVILAGAWRYMAFKDQHALSIANQTLEFLDQNLKADNGGWLEGVPASLPRRQNPHMHMFEALMSLYDATKDPTALERAGEIFNLFKTVFFDPERGLLLEYFDADWTPLDGGGPVEPGHMMEWVWLLREYEKRSGVDVDSYANVLYASAKRTGFSKQTGLLYDGVGLDGSIGSASFRIWPQLELIKAAIAQAKAGQDVQDDISNTINVLFDTYFNVDIKGGWADQFDENAQMISTNMPTSTAYHMLCAVAEVDAYLAA
ncbi:MAG: mannose-6-phosphate isomerase [Acidimicrobiales bacterium]|nr:mannose-6-phosphate isomerase [Hyphomonadaceae bacterium]RZV37238.1 MAG: mannose-6-phosphate isomerase [Acidimicrobiales bacterium]